MRFKDMTNHLWSSHRGALIWLAALLVLNVTLFVAIDQVLTPKITQKEGRFLQRQAEVRQILHNQAGSAGSPEQLYVLGSQDLAKFKQSIPSYQEFTGLIEELLVLSNKSKLNISQIGYRTEDVGDNALLQMSLNFDVSGTYKQIKQFVYTLEQSVRLITIKQVSLKGQSGDTVSLQIVLETYFQPGGQEA